jgi:hypothetical protein
MGRGEPALPAPEICSQLRIGRRAERRIGCAEERRNAEHAVDVADVVVRLSIATPFGLSVPVARHDAGL